MQKILSREFNLRISDFDLNKNIKPSAVLDLFQEVASLHANELGVGFGDLIQNKLLWVLVRVKFEIVKAPLMHSKIIAKTWPLPAGRVSLQREYLIEDAEGNTLIKGTSEWVTMHLETRKLVQNGVTYPLSEYCEDKNFTERIKKIPDFEASDEGIKIKPSYCDIDENMHVNNIRYADFVLNAYEPQNREEIAAFQMDFHKEVKMGDCVSLFMEKKENTLFAKGENKNGEKMFCCSLTFKNA